MKLVVMCMYLLKKNPTTFKSRCFKEIDFLRGVTLEEYIFSAFLIHCQSTKVQHCLPCQTANHATLSLSQVIMWQKWCHLNILHIILKYDWEKFSLVRACSKPIHFTHTAMVFETFIKGICGKQYLFHMAWLGVNYFKALCGKYIWTIPRKPIPPVPFQNISFHLWLTKEVYGHMFDSF